MDSKVSYQHEYEHVIKLTKPKKKNIEDGWQVFISTMLCPEEI